MKGTGDIGVQVAALEDEHCQTGYNNNKQHNSKADGPPAPLKARAPDIQADDLIEAPHQPHYAIGREKKHQHYAIPQHILVPLAHKIAHYTMHIIVDILIGRKQPEQIEEGGFYIIEPQVGQNRKQQQKGGRHGHQEVVGDSRGALLQAQHLPLPNKVLAHHKQ